MPSHSPIPTRAARSRENDPGALRLVRAVVSLGLLGAILAGGGCVKSVFRQGDPRTQYDRYDASRNQFVPDYISDEYGRLEPNLRGRLLEKN